VRAKIAGFTLIEALVALAILAIGMLAVHRQLGQYAISAARIEEMTLASWIATNKLAELSVAPAWPPVDDYEEEVEFAAQQWHCQIVVSETDVPNLHRVDVSVSFQNDPKTVIRKVSGLIEPPAPPGFMPPQWSMPQRRDEGGGERG
jgi:general secretion pathway protein I